MRVYSVCMLILHNNGSMISFYVSPSGMEVINSFFYVDYICLIIQVCMIFSVTKYSIFWDMRVIKEYQKNLYNCCNRDWKKIFDVEETCLVMCAVHIGIHR